VQQALRPSRDRVTTVVVLLFLWRPLFHFVFYDMFHSPGAFIFWTVVLVSAVVLWLMPPLGAERFDDPARVSRPNASEQFTAPNASEQFTALPRFRGR
jgi:hypothetical protein